MTKRLGTHATIVIWGFIVVLTGLACRRAFAVPPKVMLITTPANLQTIETGSKKEPIPIIARVDREGVQFQWALQGPGTIQPDTAPRRIFYVPPENFTQATAEITIIVTATDDQGETTQERLVFTLKGSPAQSPPSPELNDLMTSADVYFQKAFFTKPAGANAFDLYKKVLTIAPEQSHARERIYAIAAFYKSWGDRFYTQNDPEKTREYYEGYLLVARYIGETFKDHNVTPGVDSIQTRLEEVRQKIGELPALSPTQAVISPTSAPPADPRIRQIVFKPETYYVVAGETVTFMVDLPDASRQSVRVECGAIRGTASREQSVISYTAPQEAGVKDMLTIKLVDLKTEKIWDQTVIKIRIIAAIP